MARDSDYTDAVASVLGDASAAPATPAATNDASAAPVQSRFHQKFDSLLSEGLSAVGAAVPDSLKPPPVPDYSTEVASVLGNQSEQIRNNVYNASGNNPDAEAKIQHLARFMQMPPETVRSQLPQVQAQAAARQVGTLAAVPHTAQFLTDPNNAAITHDDVAGTAAVEAATKALPASSSPGLLSRIGSDVYAPIQALGGSFNKLATGLGVVGGAFPTVYDKAASLITGKPTTAAEDWYFKNAVDPGVATQSEFDAAPDAPFDVKALHAAGGLLGALSQITLSGGADAAPVVTDSALQILKTALEHGTKSMAVPALSDSMDTGRRVYAETGSGVQAAQAAEAQYVATTAGGVVPLSRAGGLVTRLATGAASGAVSGEASRQLMNTSLPQDMQQPFSAEDMILNGLTGSILAGTLGPRSEPSYHDAVRDTYQANAAANAAVDVHDAIQKLGEAASASKLRARDPERFNAFVQTVADEGPLDAVYIKGSDLIDVLNQSGVPVDQLRAQLPEVADQLHEAMQTNGDVRIPVADYATHIAGGPVDAALLPHLKTDPAGATYAQAQAYLDTQAKELQPVAQQLAQGAVQNDAADADAQSVQDAVLGQLTAAGRFRPEVNQAYAALHRSFYETQAARLGITPSELYAQHPVSIATENVAGGFGQGDANRGAYDPESHTIALLKGADLSTFLHESGHHFLETTADLARRDNAPPEIKGDMGTLLDWFGVKGSPEQPALDEWHAMSIDEKREAHEKFAQGFEHYLMSGDAPSVGLQGIFARFRTWLLHIYRHLTGAEITPEVRGVMNRMIASDAAIKEAESVRGYRPLFESAQDAGMSNDDFAKYLSLGRGATAHAVEELQRRGVRDMQWLSNAKGRAMREIQKQADAVRRDVRSSVRSEVAQQPVYRAWDFLTRAHDVEGGAARLKTDDLKALYGDAPDAPWRELTHRGMTNAETGVDPELVAEMFGFRDGRALIDALINADHPDAAIEGMTDQRMLEQHGELATPDAIERAAEASIHNDARARFIATELKALSRAAGPEAQLVRAARLAADTAIAQRRVRDLSPALHLAAEARSAKAAETALRKGEPTQAAVEKRAQILNNQLFKAATAAVEDVRKGVDYLKRFDNPNVREGIDLEYRDQIDSLLDRFDIRRSVTNKALDKREALSAFVERMASMGYEPSIPERLLDEAARQHYKDMPVEQFNGLVDAVKSIEHLGKLKSRLLDLKEQRDIDALSAEARNTMEKLPQKPAESNYGLTRIEKKWMSAKSAGRSLGASILKMEQVFDWLDNRNPNGVFNRIIFRRLADAGGREADLQRAVADKFKGLVKAMPEEVLADKRIYVADGLRDSQTGAPWKFRKSEMLALAGNVGNESNLQKVLAGEGWDESALWGFLNQHMTKADWDFVQGIGDTFESLWPEQLAMSRRLGNTNPAKLEPRPFSTPNGDYKGWYWPMIYDPARSQDVAERSARKGDALFENIYSRANTDTGRMNTRNESYARPVLFKLDAIPRVLKDVAHDVAYREAVIDADKFLSNATVRDGIIKALGPEYYAQMRPWLQSIANERLDGAALKFWEGFARGARTRATMVGLGFRLTTMVVHGASAGMESVAELGPKWFGSGLADFVNPAQWSANKDFVFERSAEMRNRMTEVDRDIREHLRLIDLELMDPATSAIKRGADAVKAHAYTGIAMLDMASALPTWMGAYKKAMTPIERGGLGMGEQDAVYFADKTVRNAHGGTGAKDLAAVQRGNEFMKLFTMFYSFWNHNANRLADTARLAKGLPATYRSGDMGKFRGDLGRIVMRTLIYTLGVQLMHSALRPKKDDQGEENWAEWVAKELALSAAGGIPLVRDASEYFIGGKQYEATPAAGVVSAIGLSIKDTKHALAQDGEVSDNWIKHAANTAGYAFGVPSGQAGNTAQFLWDVDNGRQDPQSLADWWRGVLTGQAQKH